MNRCLNQLTKPYAHCIPSLPLFLLPLFSLEVGGVSYGDKHRGDPIDLSCFLFFFLSFFIFFWCGSGGIWLSFIIICFLFDLRGFVTMVCLVDSGCRIVAWRGVAWGGGG